MIGKEILNYTILSFIGKGGMGSVYLAEHKYIKQQKVAIKVINADMVNDFTRSRLQQEAEALARLNHPNIVHFLDYHIDENGNIYLIEEYAEGVSLEKYINEINGLIVEDRICTLFEPILDAMSYAHKMHVLHRDLKPTNIIITADSTPKILDFGIATLMREDAQEDGMIIGTPSYMSPEQVKGEKLDEKSDIYSLGVVLYQMLTGVAPYDTTTMSEFEINRHVVEETLPRLKSYYKYTSDTMQKIVDKATAKDKSKRYQSCNDFKKALHQAIYPASISMKAKIAAALFVLVFIGGGLLIWDYNRVKVSYYKDYVEQWGVPVGIGKLNTSDVQHREHSYQVKTKAGKTISLALINGSGKLANHTDSEHTYSRNSLVKYFYSSNGNIDYKEVYSKDSVLLFQMDYSDNLRTAIFRRNDQFHTEMDLQAHTTNLTSKDGIFERSRISRHLFTYDENGFLIEKMFAGFQNVKRCDADRIYGIRYKHDNLGRVIEEQFIGMDGNPQGNSFGLAIKLFTYDDKENWTSVTYLNSGRKQSHDGNNCCVVKLEYDQWGNRIKETYYSLDGTPSLRTDIGCYGFSYVFNDKGNRIKQTTLGHDFQSAYNKYGYVSNILTYDDNGFLIAEQVVDENDNPVLNHSESNLLGYSSSQYVIDSHGNTLEMRAYDENGNIYETNGISTIRVEYDDSYQTTKISYFNSNDEPAEVGGHYHYFTNEYDSIQQLISVHYYDANGEPTECNEGFAEQRMVYDVHGACTQIACYGIDGKPTMCVSRYAFEELQYDEQGNLVWIRFFSPKHKSCMSSYQYASREIQYDPVTNNEILNIDYDPNGNIIAKYYYEYDNRGNNTKYYATNAANKLEQGAVVYNYEYDEMNRITRVWYTDLSGKRCNYNKSSKYAEERYEYDDSGNKAAIVWFGIDGKPALNSDFVHRRERKFNAYNKIIHELNLSIDLKPVSGKNVNPEGTVAYDNYGRMTELACFDGYGKPRVTADGYHRQTYEYDIHGLLICSKTYDVKGNLTETKSDGYAKIEYDYNARNQNVEKHYFNKDNIPVCVEKNTYNNKGMITEWCIFDGKHRYNDSKYGYSKLIIEYDESEIVPIRRMFYQEGSKLLAWQLYDRQKNQWSEYNYGPVTNSASPKSNASSQPSTKASTSNSNWAKAVSDFNSSCPLVAKKESQYTLNVISAVSITDKKVKITFRTDCSKYEMLDADIKACKLVCQNKLKSYRSQWNLPQAVSIVYELQDSKGRILN